MADKKSDAEACGSYPAPDCSTGFVSMGRNPNCELTCGFPKCGHLTEAIFRNGGWCELRENRVPPCDGWPTGFTPSVASTGGCDRHTSNPGVQATAHKGQG